MKAVLVDASFAVVMITVYFTGMVLFMLPPVPGPIIYLFAGLLLSEVSPWGFSAGCVASVLLCAVLKFSACAVQQKLIGECLGTRTKVPRLVGVHKPFVRAVERVLKTPGLSVGKSAVLCGGPDWPTSVLAGMLRVPLWEALVGTIPVMGSLVPMALLGAFIAKAVDDESGHYKRAQDMMSLLTIVTSAFFWGASFWSIQDQYEHHYESLIASRPEHKELEDMDCRNRMIEERLKKVPMPKAVQNIYFFGGLLNVVVFPMLFLKNMLVKTYEPTSDIGDVRFTGQDGFLKPLGAAVICVLTFAFIGYIVGCCWLARTRAALQNNQSDVKPSSTVGSSTITPSSPSVGSDQENTANISTLDRE